MPRKSPYRVALTNEELQSLREVARKDTSPNLRPRARGGCRPPWLSPGPRPVPKYRKVVPPGRLQGGMFSQLSDCVRRQPGGPVGAWFNTRA